MAAPGNTRTLLLLLLVVLVVDTVLCQDDAGADLDLESMSVGQEGPEAGAATPVLVEERTLWQQTQRAAMQFSVIAGVCFMVGLAFGLMIVVEESLSRLWTVVERRLGRHQEAELSPAQMVGSFSRYK